MNPNSALIWLPRIQDAGLPVPRTEIVRYNPQDLFPMFDNQPIRDGFHLDELRAACERIGFPVFLRSDLSSAKHARKLAWKVEGQDGLVQAVFETFEDNEMKWLASATQAFLIREYLPLKHSFEAFNGLPIARERRYFVDQEGVRCSHPYWPEEAIYHHPGLPEDWKESLAELSKLPDANDMDMLSSLSKKAVTVIGHGTWSVDWAQDVEGKWWLIDMATAAESWHPDCPWK